MIEIPSGPLSPTTAKQLTRLLSELEGLRNLRTTAPLSFSFNSGIPLLAAHIVPRVLARITGQGCVEGSTCETSFSCGYSWEEVETRNCEAQVVQGGKRGYLNRQPALEITGSSTVEEGTIVELWQAPEYDRWYFQQGGGGDGGWFDVAIALAGEDCALDSLGQPITVTPTYTATHVISSSTVGGAFETHPDGRVWDGVNDRVFEANGRLVNPGTRVRIKYMNTVTHDNGDGTTTTFRQWMFWYDERDPTCLLRVITDLSAGDEESQCNECYTYLAVPGQLITTTPDGAPCVLDKNTCFELSVE